MTRSPSASDQRVTIIDAKTVLDLVFAARIEAWLRDHDW
jgi:hypothetical protein